MNKCEVYETKKKNTFVFVKQSKDIAKIPDVVKKRLEPLKHFKTVDLGKILVAADTKKILAELGAQGFSINSVEISFKITSGR